MRIEITSNSVEARPPDRRRRALAVEPLGQRTAQPFLRWAGGKQWLAQAMPALAPASFQSYFEPFLGGGSVFFSLRPSDAHLSDANQELIRTYLALRDQPRKVIDNLRRWKYDRDVFQKVRNLSTRTETSHAARFVYLNRTAFNGIYRVNRDGRFNVPFGRFVNPQICNRERLEECSSYLRRATSIAALDFEDAVSAAKKHDFVYLDPPYITGHMNNGFVKWNAKLFSWQDQERLASLAADLTHRGVYVLISNADHPAVSALYDGLHKYRLGRPSQIAAETAKRRPVSELLLASYPLLGIPSPG